MEQHATDAQHDEQQEQQEQQHEQHGGAWGGTGYVRREPDPEVVAWWWRLPEPTRAELAGLRPGQVLPPAAARALHDVGVATPEVVVVEDGRRVRRAVASRDVISTVLMVRLTHSERRLV
ncbi:hypothetical protein [Kineococcus aurantiacus]|uniref:Heme/copper-type cytochrome/quinol oxidase subunit 2 n=1 Tax=Kineococcus aurantiacus TaxID=37633 RepID=A0A7Y9DNH5_9ACTN|nr:hypothetical protein [Kineococcus aurantiacus]NYD23773.1 heme/copper-type cytochrome/quinol oxidase subunit 2 [Kineococcus aurantiacus]